MFVGNPLFSQPLITLSEENKSLSIGNLLYFYEDKSTQLTINHIIAPTFQPHFQLSSQTIPNFDITNATIWLKFQLRNSTSEKCFLEIDNPNIDSITIYYLADKREVVKIISTGAALSASSRDVHLNNFVVGLPIKTSETGTFYISLRSKSWLNIPISIGTYKSIFPSLSKKNALIVLYLGIIFSMFLYNLFIYFITREQAYIYYLLYVATYGLLLYHSAGFSSLFDNAGRFYINLFLFRIFVVVFLVFFTQKFLKVTVENKISYYLLQFVLLTCAIDIFAYLFDFFVIMVWLDNIISTLIRVIGVSVAIIRFREGYLPARFYMVAFCFPLITKFYLFFARLNIFPYVEEMYHFIPAGEPLQMLFLAFALADKISMLTKENHKIHKENIKLAEVQKEDLAEKVANRTQEIEHLNVSLEKKITERTQELQHTIKDLSHQYQTLEQFSYIISHNIRSPIARIQGLLNIYNKKNLQDPLNQEVWGYLEQATRDLDNTIKDLTQVIAIRNSFDKTLEKIYLTDILQIILASLQHEIENANAQISVDILRANELFSVKTYIQSVVYNLISNAIKYRYARRPLHIEIKSENVGDLICFSVQDNGVGIDMENTDKYKIFGMYQRMHTHVEGKGLGLYLVKTQIEALGGNVEVESELNVGTIFKVYLPNHKKQINANDAETYEV
jgi:signal transduction histidine kinase